MMAMPFETGAEGHKEVERGRFRPGVDKVFEQVKFLGHGVLPGREHPF